MKIKNIKINNYGNLENKEINLKNKINIIYGKNESGKSTLLNFIKNIFYGISKNKNRKNISDYEKYKTWGKEDFSGKIKYELDDGTEFEIFRDFNKKNPKVFNSELEDISKKFNIVKKDGLQFFYEQTNVDEEMFTSTVVAMQKEVNLEKQDQNILVQKLANLAGTGDDNLSYKKVMDKLNKMQIEEIGSERTQGRPINIVKERIRNIELVLKDLKQYQKDKENSENKKNNILEKIVILEKEINLYKQLNMVKAKIQSEENKIKIKNNFKNEKDEKIKELNLEQEKINKKIEENNKKINKKNNYEENNLNKKINLKRYGIILFVILIFNIIFSYFNSKFIKINLLHIFNYLIIPIYLIVIIILEKNKIKKLNKKIKLKNEKIQEEINLENKKYIYEIDLINKHIELLKDEKNKQEKELENEKKNLDDLIESEIEKIKKEFKDVFNINNYIDEIENDNIENIITKKIDELNKNKLELKTIDIQEINLLNKIEEIVNLKEAYDEAKEKMHELEKRNEAINLTKKLLTNAYTNMKNNITPKFTQNLSNNISKITKNKYTKVSINDEKGLIVENEYGEYIPCELLSIGTIEQLYLSLRLSMIDDLSSEKMPIMLDEAFAYYDNERLENILNFLSENMHEHQVIIFTCTKREKEILNNLGIEYNWVEL